jgi:hypothetical protein
MRRNAGFWLFLVTAGLLLSVPGLIAFNLYIDLLFFREIDLLVVFKGIISTKIIAGLLFSLFFLAFYLLNTILALRTRFPLRNLHIFGDTIYPVRTFSLDRPVRLITLLAGIILAVFVFLYGTSRWHEILLFLNRVDVGIKDPIFEKDISFYLFTMPFLEAIKGFAGLVVALTMIATITGYLFRGGIAVSERSISLSPPVRRHIALFGAFISIIMAFGFYLDAYRLLFSDHGFIYGANYTDIKARLMTLRLLVPLTVITGIALVVASFRGRFKWLMIPAGITILVYIGGMVAYAPFLQKFKVAPNELELERPYIENNIRLTRFGYDLDRIELKPFDVSYDLDMEDIIRNNATIKNIRLWDNSPLLKTYSQLQQIRTYYKFVDVDNDRYIINGEYMQVMLSPRELSYDDLPSRSWINERLVFTHGNGIAMGPVSRISREGLPEFIIKDIPPVSSADIRITRPEIYYGELSNEYVIVKTKVREFSYPTSTGNVYTRYEGTGGVELSSFVRRVIFAIRFNTSKIFLSTDITPESRILFYRNIRERLNKIAPFLIYDADPYLVISDRGRLFWIVDAYTASGNLPYSMPISRGINYLRNSVKVVIDAYNGRVWFYISDPEDVIIRVYARAFPGVFRGMEEMPEDLKRHIRYPQGMLEVQARMFAVYHMTDPKVFYNREDLWEIPAYTERPMQPYNTIMKLPGEEKEEYILLIPYTPSKRDNLAAWLAARCDMPNYGNLIVYVFPRDRLVFGPRQINARIDQDAYISQQLTLWGQIGSQVIRGSLLVIPIENSLIYVQPLYLSASDRVGLPELRRVIVAYENEVVMEEDLERALKRLFLKEAVKPAVEVRKGTEGLSPKELAKEAMRVFERARQMQRQGDWAGYGEQLKRLEELLRKMAK